MQFPRVQPLYFTRSMTIVCGLFLLTGCAHRGAKAPPPPTEAELCSSLLNVVAQADLRFQSLKTTPTLDPLTGVTTWETKPVFPDSRCNVVEWGGGRINYVCTWPEGTEAQARGTYQRVLPMMSRCLGQPWTLAETRGQTGTAALFKKPGAKAQAVMRYFKPRGGYSPAWETSLTIGDEVTPDAR